jgi:hypothetical protein
VADYAIFPVRPEDVIDDEALGSKTKFWFRRDGRRWLFKEARDTTGEDWAEKVAAEVAHLVGIPAATVELAEFEGRRGCASLSFVDREAGEGLIHGNEILAGMVFGYDRTKTFHQSDHTLDNIQAAIRKLFPDKGTHDSILTTLAGYMVLDGLIGNTDRHHENWALLLRQVKSDKGVSMILGVAPSFDHASSLGRELQDAKRLNLVRSGAVGRYVRNGRGAIYLATTDRNGANPLRLAEISARREHAYFAPSLGLLEQVKPTDFREIVNRVPVVRMSEASKDFVIAFLSYTYQALAKLPK